MGEYNRSAWTDSWVTFEGRHFAHFSNGDTYFVHSNRIGTTNLVTDWNTGTVVQDELHYPWGQVWTSAGSMVEERFASLQHRDAGSNFDPTEYRMFSSDVGRWTTPDPADQYPATPTDPQTFNRYAYVLNNSTNLSDPCG
ncbi:MAG TPA: RHS repeat-associated core domain-containing protein [Terriglobia bacterium]|nr:RHS repeat-associated core domain-containing protein [Terriglobia bacterium]